MIIPIGHEEESCRRLPVVTFGVMALCLLGFILSGQLSTSAYDVEGVEEFEEVVEYYFEHPYLELDDELKKRLFEGVSEREIETLIEVYRSEYPKPETAALLKEEQERLDALTGDFLDAFGEHSFFRFGLVPNDPNPIAFLTHMFLHGGWLHLIGNMLILYLAGPFIEDVWGRPLYAGFYVVAGLVAALSFMLPNLESGIPMIGASGAIAGVMGAFLVRYRTTHIRFFYWFGLLFRGTFSAPAWVMLPLWFGEQVFMASMLAGIEGGGVAYMAHIGGFLFGVGAALGIRHWGIEARMESTIESKITSTVVHNPTIEQALHAAAAGNGDEAVTMLAEEARRDPNDAELGLAFWGLATDHERAAEAAPALVRVIRDELRRGESELALTHWTELTQRVPAVEASPDLLVRLAQLLQREGRTAEAAAALRRAMLGGGSTMPPALALRIARLAGSLDAHIALGAARLALAHPDVQEPERAQAEQLLAS
jgi:membrane associated rhomboid family serine protease